MNLNQLKLFYLAVKKESLSKAAQELNITQPAVTKGIRRIQEHYEVQLVHRLGRKLVLTEVGEALYKTAERIFELDKLAEEVLHEYQQKKLKQLHIHASESFGAYFLPSIINHFNQLNPEIHVTVDIVSNRRVVENTVNLQNDLGFISSPVNNKRLVMHEVLEDEPVIIVSPDHPFADRDMLEPGDLEGQVMIMHEEGSVFQKVVNTIMTDSCVTLFMPITLSNNEAIKRSVEGKRGIAIMSRTVADKEIQSGKLKAVPIANPSIRRKFYLIHHRDKFLSTTLKNFKDMVEQWKPGATR